MTRGLETTFQVLTATANEAANRLLIPALDSEYVSIRDTAFSSILARRSATGHREILNRLHTLDERLRPLLQGSHPNMNPALRAAILSNDPQLCVNGCTAAVWFREYDMVPALLNALEDPSHPNAALVAETLLELVDFLCAELAAPIGPRKQRDPQLTRRHVVDSLELSIGRFARHHRKEVLDAFMRLVYRDNSLLTDILKNPHHTAFLVMVDMLSKSSQLEVMRMLLSFLDDPQSPSAALNLIARRVDRPFVEMFLHKIGYQPLPQVVRNLKRMDRIAWARNAAHVLGALDDLAQYAAVQVLMYSGTPREEIFRALAFLLRSGKSIGRRAAAEALASFSGAEANELAVAALDDPDPEVQAKILPQLRQRGIPGAMTKLVEAFDSPHPVVRMAAQQCLAEFTFERYLTGYDVLDDDVRKSTGELVKRIDRRTLQLLRSEMKSRLRTRRLRALSVARTLEMTEDAEDTIIDLLQDEDHMVRAEAAMTLATCRSNASLEALREALNDRSAIVQESARSSLEERGVYITATSVPRPTWGPEEETP